MARRASGHYARCADPGDEHEIHIDGGAGLRRAGAGRRLERRSNGIRCSMDATCPAGPSRSRSIRWARTTPTRFASRTACSRCRYDRYGKFDEQFGHLYSNQPYSNYILRLEYRITGTAVADSPPWAKLNSGVMIHSQSPLSMEVGPALARQHGVAVSGGGRRPRADRPAMSARRAPTWCVTANCSRITSSIRLRNCIRSMNG